MGRPKSLRLELLRSAPLDSWIAVSQDESRVLATGKTFVEADTAAQQTGKEGYFLIKTPDAWISRTLL
jgi:hypothetical protein